MHEVVFAYDDRNGFNELTKLAGKKVRTFDDAIALLEAGQSLTLRIGSGTWKGYYKSVGKDENGTGWIQRRCSTEF